MSRVVQQDRTTISDLECALFSGGVPFIVAFFDRLGPKEICQLSKTNRRMLSVCRFYVLMRWDVLGLVSRFFVEEEKALALFTAENAILFGPAVVKFFDRAKKIHFALDVCVNVETLERIVAFLESEGFKYVSNSAKGNTFRAEIAGEIARTPVEELKSSGERNSSEINRSPWGPYDFVREPHSTFRRLRLHVVRCEPYRYILSLYSTGLMNFIGWGCAVSLFPNSTFCHRRSYVSRQECTSEASFSSSFHTWFEDYAAARGISIVEYGYKVFKGVEKGERYIGDGHCWVIPDRYCDPEALIKVSNGPYFEVLDWRSGTTRADSYLRIGEPGVWSANSPSELIICGNPTCLISNREQSLRRCGGCGCKSYCGKECQVADWPVHKIACREVAPRLPKSPWTQAVLKYNAEFGSRAASYGLGLAFGACTFDLMRPPTEVEWRRLWSRIACCVELRLDEKVIEGDVKSYKVTYHRAYAAKVEDELPSTRVLKYRRNVALRDWPVGLLYKVVSPPDGIVETVTSVTRPLRSSDVLAPVFYIANMAASGGALEGTFGER
ncbi:hypothetical protein CVT26_015053 [Gymnopilus dilepis]|uniref:MYND-type domain-containing protein n=1 Tax=Gymnopilus dilepis TaxID=231916 RepID=A0A409WXU7_9AGAR|nr:hypothetical protein CVT26_015053 [Gymnopilus dilepis]